MSQSEVKKNENIKTWKYGEECWFKRLEELGKLQEHDLGAGDDLEIDHELVIQGQIYFNQNYFSVLVNMLIGLYSLMFVPTIVRILHLTGKSGTPALSFQRYLRTLNHTVTWFKGVDSMKSSLRQVLQLHRAAAAKGRNTVIEGKSISQFDMVITQWGFLGPLLMFPHKIGVKDTADSSLEGVVYMFYLVGKSLGVHDEFNLCKGGARLAKQRCQHILRQVIQPGLLNEGRISRFMADHLLNGVNVINPFIFQDSFREYVETVLMEKNFDSPALKGIMLFHFKTITFIFQTGLQLPGGLLLRVWFNQLMKLNILLCLDQEDVIVKGLETIKSSPIDRFLGIMNIPVIMVKTFYKHLSIYIRTILEKRGKEVGVLAVLLLVRNYIYLGLCCRKE
ncbi:uncharacterized protein LOC111697631 isoform X2 [Eurytemora carolleeae]|uniref:uncharacterized protein LOC111697631 isoform X2 n=1 Tax=Eurytemora carolleeae TaxID=1294199 RepID=UPI000C781936|nr:uncharacterized protein LOC111697631 isoform X2 [Eurytemora carolleeae]|eukprot:XP_023323466.1 uncharacterized protein LOC111697631 isoform X2 [Eurytemora affinis]